MKITKLRIVDLCEQGPSVNGGLPTDTTSYVEEVSM